MLDLRTHTLREMLMDIIFAMDLWRSGADDLNEMRLFELSDAIKRELNRRKTDEDNRRQNKI